MKNVKKSFWLYWFFISWFGFIISIPIYDRYEDLGTILGWGFCISGMASVLGQLVIWAFRKWFKRND